MMRTLLILAMSAITSACVSAIPLEDQAPQSAYHPDTTLLVSVVDERQRVKDGKEPNFIGVAHGAFGIPVDWHVDPVLATADGDAQRTLAQFIQHRLITGLTASGWRVKPASFSEMPSQEDVIDALNQNDADLLINLAIKEWYFSINLNWVSAFNFDTDTDVTIFDSGGETLLFKKIAGRDVIDESASDSHQNHILRAYRQQLQEILADPEIRQLLEAHAESAATG